MDFSDAIKLDNSHTRTENGAKALNTTSDGRLDLFGTIGAFRNTIYDRKIALYENSYKVDPTFTTKILFYARDIRGGLGERQTFRGLVNYAARQHPETIRGNIWLIPHYGRWDDLYSLVDTPLEHEMWAFMKKQFEKDLANIELHGTAEVSLLAKWIKSPDASSKESKRLGILTANKLGYTVYDFKRKIRAIRKYLDVTERKMSAKEWESIVYPNVPSKAMNNYRNAFMRNDCQRFYQYMKDVRKGKQKINAGVLFPYDIVEKYMYHRNVGIDSVLEEQWKALPNYVDKPMNAIVMADISWSMYGRPMATSVGLAIYFAEHNTGVYHNLFMTFDSEPTFVSLKSDTLEEKIRLFMGTPWGGNTNLKLAFQKILDVAIENQVTQEEMPKSLIVITDMEIDNCGTSWDFYESMSELFTENGYQIPNVVFWNVDSRHDTFLTKSEWKGVQLVSGQSASTFGNLIESFSYSPVELMEKIINSDRYKWIK